MSRGHWSSEKEEQRGKDRSKVGLIFKNMSSDFIERNRAILEAAGVELPPPPSPQEPEPPTAPIAAQTPPPAPGQKRKVHYKKDPEKQLQNTCRCLLIHRGYVEMTPTNLAERAADAHGWFGHIVKPQGNPIMPDLFIFDAHQNHCLMVELKTHNVYQVGQKEMIEAGNWELATDYSEFLKILGDWEKKLLPGTGTGARE